MSEPTAALVTLRASTADLVQALAADPWSDEQMRAPSLCEGWTRGHVLTHLARNADGIAATLSGALRGEIVPRYPDGWAARNAAIDDGAKRPADELVADVTESADRLDRVLGAVADAGAWSAETEKGHPAQDWLARRLREVEVHRVDLAGNYGPDRWPALLVSELLPDAAASLPGRTERALRVTLTADGALLPDLVGREWSADGEGPEETVTGPDWAATAWLIGRGSVVADALSATPPLGPWD